MIRIETADRGQGKRASVGTMFGTTLTCYGQMRDTGAYGLAAAANSLAAEGVFRASAEVRIAIPEDMDKSRIHSIRNHMLRARDRLAEEGFVLEELRTAGGKNRGVLTPAVTVTVLGSAEDSGTAEIKEAVPGQDLLVAGWIGLEGMLRIIGEKEAELRRRFAADFIRRMKAYDREVCGISRIAAARDQGVSMIRQVLDGGILACLWEFAEEAGTGLSLDMKKLPILQETIEVCEYFRLNPYQLTSAGCFVMAAENGEEAVRMLRRRGIPAVLIGQLTDSHDRVIYNGGDVRYIDRPGPDELMKVF